MSRTLVSFSAAASVDQRDSHRLEPIEKPWNTMFKKTVATDSVSPMLFR